MPAGFFFSTKTFDSDWPFGTFWVSVDLILRTIWHSSKVGIILLQALSSHLIQFYRCCKGSWNTQTLLCKWWVNMSFQSDSVQSPWRGEIDLCISPALSRNARHVLNRLHNCWLVVKRGIGKLTSLCFLRFYFTQFLISAGWVFQRYALSRCMARSPASLLFYCPPRFISRGVWSQKWFKEVILTSGGKWGEQCS